MSTKTLMTAAALAGILSLATATAMAEEAHDHAKATADTPETEKCYGVAKSGKNDCGTNAHACAGHADAADGDKNEWLLLPAGLCEKLVNGSLMPPAAESPKADTPAKTEEKKAE